MTTVRRPIAILYRKKGSNSLSGAVVKVRIEEFELMFEQGPIAEKERWAKMHEEGGKKGYILGFAHLENPESWYVQGGIE